MEESAGKGTLGVSVDLCVLSGLGNPHPLAILPEPRAGVLSNNRWFSSSEGGYSLPQRPTSSRELPPTRQLLSREANPSPGSTQILPGDKDLRRLCPKPTNTDECASDTLNGPQNLFSAGPKKLNLLHKEEIDSNFVSCCEIFFQELRSVRQHDTAKMIGCRELFKATVVPKLKLVRAQSS